MTRGAGGNGAVPVGVDHRSPGRHLTNQTMSLLSGKTACPFILSIIPKTHRKKRA